MKKFSMRTIRSFVVPVLLVTIFMASCSDHRRTTETTVHVDRYESFVDSVTRADVYTEDEWMRIEREHQAHMADVDRQNLTEAERHRLDEAERRFEDMRDRYDLAQRMERSGTETVEELRAQMGVQRGDAQLQGLNQNNIKEAYEQFVLTVEDNSDAYTREEWNEIDRLWDRLNERRDQLENIPTADNARIMELRVRYGATRSIHKPADKDKDKDHDRDKDLDRDPENGGTY